MVWNQRAFDAVKKEGERRTRIRKAQHMATKGYSNVEIAKELDVSESTVRTLLVEKLPS